MSATPSSVQAIELKGRMMLVSVLRVYQTDPQVLGEVLAARREQAPELMRDMPIVLDLEAVAESPESDLQATIERVRAEGFKLIGLQAGEVAERLQSYAELFDVLPVLQLGGRGGAPTGEVSLEDETPAPERADEAQEKSAPAEVAAVHSATRIVDQPVRSGQQIYARGGDLIVTGAVSPGAELLADGHIHVLGPLRGRALAGVRGLVTARIFCRRLDAELLSIAGHYRIAEDITEAERGENRLVTLDGESLKIAEI
ncbi:MULTISPECIES: septum site-determining protein MinC [unclassified Thioalkalivibrio]|uniref:septum site-determining protein MinC n=1 Tax=unclassified Thioalkalivibrio TaxID=2621013 RepID=UPI00036EA186|nr:MULTISPECIES: septum site-determining protein MinC [unclassified Thioalkalivibrio]